VHRDQFAFSLLQVADLAPDPAATAESHGAKAKLGDEEAGTPQCVMAHGQRS